VKELGATDHATDHRQQRRDATHDQGDALDALQRTASRIGKF
jgi:hypothetical protein